MGQVIPSTGLLAVSLPILNPDPDWASARSAMPVLRKCEQSICALKSRWRRVTDNGFVGHQKRVNRGSSYFAGI